MLKELIKSTLPYSITSNVVTNDMIDTFLEYIEKNNYVSFDITEFYRNHNTIVSKELIKIYLENLYSGFQDAITDPNIIKALAKHFVFAGTTSIDSNRITFNTVPVTEKCLLTEESIDISLEQSTDLIDTNETADSDNVVLSYLLAEQLDSVGDPTFIDSVMTTILQFDMNYFKQLQDFLTEEFLYTSKAFKQKKGTKPAIQYCYNIFRQSGLQSDGFPLGIKDPSYNLYDSNFYTLTYSSEIIGKTKITLPPIYNIATFTVCTRKNNSVVYPLDMKVIINTTFISNNVTTNVFLGYRLNTADNIPEEFTADTINFYNINQGDSLEIPITYTNNSGSNVTNHIHVDGNYSKIIDSQFSYNVEGSLFGEIYENGIKPIVHPIGFKYLYTKLLLTILNSTYNGSLNYNITELDVKCYNNGFNIISYPFTVSKILTTYNAWFSDKIVITFIDGASLVKDYDGVITSYNIDGSTNVIYPNGCSLNLQYTTTITSTIQENLGFEIDYFINENVTTQSLENSINDQTDVAITDQSGNNIVTGITSTNISEGVTYELETYFWLTTNNGINITDNNNDELVFTHIISSTN